MIRFAPNTSHELRVELLRRAAALARRGDVVDRGLDVDVRIVCEGEQRLEHAVSGGAPTLWPQECSNATFTSG